jgi:DHA3 family macrolide efflux protein-like MFS transporter
MRNISVKKMKAVFKNKAFVKLFFANFTSQMGSVVGVTAFVFYLLDRFSDQPSYATISELMVSLPTLAVFFLVGVFADRMDRQKIASNCDLISASLSIVLIGAIWIGSIPIIFSILFLRSGVQKFFFPAESGIMQGILTKDEYAASAGINQMVGSVFMLFGGGLGILAYWLTGIYGAVFIDAITFIISSFLIRSIDVPRDVRLPNGKHTLKELNLKFVMKDFHEGLKYILKDKLLLSLIFGFFIFGVVNGGFSVMPIFILKYKLVPDTYKEFSVIFGVIEGSGFLIGSIVSSMIQEKFKFHQLIVTGLLISGGFIILSAFSNSTWMFLALMFLSSLGLPLVNIALGGWLPGLVDPKMMGRVQGWVSPLMMLSQTITLFLISISFPKIISIEMLYWVVGGCLILVALIYTILLPRFMGKSTPSNVLEKVNVPS